MLYEPAGTVEGAAAGLLCLRDKVAAPRRADLAGLAIITALGPAYRRPDGVHVLPITTLGP